jgi:carboxymethylenebutenolidase
MVELETTGGTIPAYRADPAGEPRGGVLVIHEIWGLADHIKDVADRFAAEGYLAVAPDILSNAGVPPELGAELQRLMQSPDERERTEAQPRMREALSVSRSPDYAEWAVMVLTQVVDYLAVQHGVDDRIAVVGFCFGGTYTYAVAAEDTRVRAAVPFYGAAPEFATLADIRARVLAFYGERDERITSGLPALRDAMADAGVDFTPLVYPGTAHAFFNDTSPSRYDGDAAADAWRRTLDFLADTLGAVPNR